MPAMRRAGRHWFHYWKAEQIRYALEGGDLPYSSSDQFAKVRKGDTVWVINAKNGELVTIGYILVDLVTDSRKQARERLRRPPWGRNYHVFAKGDGVRPIRTSLQGIVRQLRFISDLNPRLA